MFGKCKVCLEKDKRIEDLKHTLTLLNKLVFPQPNGNSREMNQVLNASNEIIELNPDKLQELKEQRQEESKILFGMY